MSNEWSQFKHQAQPTEFEDHASRVAGGNLAAMVLDTWTHGSDRNSPLAQVVGGVLDAAVGSIYGQADTEKTALEITAKLANDPASVKILCDRFGIQPPPQNPHEAAEMLHACLIGDANNGQPGLFESMNEQQFAQWAKNPIAMVRTYGMIDQLDKNPMLVHDMAKQMGVDLPQGDANAARQFLEQQVPLFMSMRDTDPHGWQRWIQNPQRMAEITAHGQQILDQLCRDPVKFSAVAMQLMNGNDDGSTRHLDTPQQRAQWLGQHQLIHRLYSLGDNDFTDFQKYANDPLAGAAFVFTGYRPTI